MNFRLLATGYKLAAPAALPVPSLLASRLSSTPSPPNSLYLNIFHLRKISALRATVEASIRNQALGVTMNRNQRNSKDPKKTEPHRKPRSKADLDPRKSSARRGRATKTPARAKAPQGRRRVADKAKPGIADAPSDTTPETPSLDAEPGLAAERLRNSLNSKVSAQFDDIAQAVIDTTKKGNMTGARLIMEMTGVNNLAHEEKGADVSHLNIPDPELLAAEPEWKDPEVGDIWVGDRWESPSQPPNPNPER